MGRRGPRAMSIDLDEGRVLDMSTRPPPGAEEVAVELVRPIAASVFDACPICGDPATDDEHVPPRSLGGRVMTKTCEPCNNRLGTRVEADLADWFDQALTLPAFSGGAVRGWRHSARILWRITPNDEFVLVIDGNADPGVIDLLRSGQVDLAAGLPNRNRYHLALLKHMYLAACLERGGPTPDGAAIRADLISARDAVDRDSIRDSRIALGLHVLRIDGPAAASAGPLAVAVAQVDDAQIEGVLLAGSVFVSWTSDPNRVVPSATPRRLQVAMDVGGKIDGVVRSVDFT